MLRYLKKNGRGKKVIASFAFVGTLLSTSLQGHALANYFIGGDVYSPASNIKGAYAEIWTSTYAPLSSGQMNTEWPMIYGDQQLVEITWHK